jgi:hypothetical protein
MNDDWDDFKQIMIDGALCIAFVAAAAMVAGFIVGWMA